MFLVAVLLAALGVGLIGVLMELVLLRRKGGLREGLIERGR